MFSSASIHPEFYLGFLVAIAIVVAIITGIAFLVKFLTEATPDVLFFIAALAIFLIFVLCNGVGILSVPPLF